MTSRERIRTIIAGRLADRVGFWMGSPHADTWPIYLRHFATTDRAVVRRALGDDFAWVSPVHKPSDTPAPPPRASHGQSGPLADCEDVRQLDAIDWPNPDRIDIEASVAALRGAGDLYRAGGMWTPFYHELMRLFGMEHYMMKMYTNPEVVLAATDRVCQYHYAVNERLFAAAGDELDGFFFGNDFGTQQDLIISPALFDRFILPWFRRFTEQAHRFGRQVILHSCGSIHRVIGRLIDAGVNCLHPLQARAANMDAARLAADFKGRIAFFGGIDTQELLVHGTPDQVRAEVRRVKGLLGPNLIVSPSHEALLPNVPPENVIAMSEAARE